jgi:signal transduction histidine kinase
MTLRNRLAVLIGLAIILAVSAQAWIGYFEFRRAVIDDLDRDLGQVVALVTTQIEPNMTNFTQIRATYENYVAKARIVVDNKVIASFHGSFPEGLGQANFSARDLGNWRIISVALPGFAANARLDAAISSKDYIISLERYTRIAMLNTIIFTVLGTVLAFFLAQAALLPLRTLISTIHRVSDSGDLLERVRTRGQGELPSLASSFNTMLERLSAFRQRESEFINNASHELRTPITAMTLNIGTYREGLQSAKETIDDLEQSLRQMQDLTQSLLLLAREGRAEKNNFDLVQLLQIIADQYEVSYFGLQKLIFYGDATLLCRAVENLLENARKYAANTEQSLSLTIKSKTIIITITDGGTGMPADLLPRATKPFERGNSQTSGTGLGLSIVERIAQVHGGTMRLENLVPKGFLVHLELPI